MLREMPLISIVIPVFNEQESICETAKRLLLLRKDLEGLVNVELLFVDDGSSDASLVMLKELAFSHTSIKVIALSRNFGHQIAITAGLDGANGDYVAIIDADLQDPPELIGQMYLIALEEGCDIVYGKRKSRAGESWFKEKTASAFYRVFSYMCEIKIPYDTGDFRLMSRRAVDAFKLMRERNRFVRGMVTWAGFKSVSFEYHRSKRYAGVTKYPLRKMLSFALNAILSFSKKPLTLAVRLGFLIVLFGIFFGMYITYLKLFTSIPVPGLTVIVLLIVIFGGAQIFLIGVVGMYIARIFEEVKMRPLYLVAETIGL